jgi:hypothetical protein
MGKEKMRPTSANSAFSSNVLEFTAADPKMMIIQPNFEWRKAAVARLEKLVRLPVGWDGYSGQPVGLLNANFALQMLDTMCGSNAGSPQFVPGADGDLQIEWHTLLGDVELHVIEPNHVHAWRCVVGAPPYEEEVKLTNEFSKVAAWVKEIAEPPRAIATAAA